jgi:integrase
MILVGEPEGLSIEVRQSGKHIYRFTYTQRKKVRHIYMGSTRNITVEQAVDIAQQYRATLLLGEDPRLGARGHYPFDEVWQEYFVEHVARKLRPNTQVMYRNMYEKYAKEFFADFTIAEVSRPDVSELFRELSKTTPGSANTVRSMLSGLFTYAEEVGYRKQNTHPVKGIKPNRNKVIERYLSDAERVRLSAVLDREEGEDAAELIRFLLLTGLRRSEAEALRWEWIDWEKNLMVFPAEKHKTGTNGKDKTLPLMPQAVEVLSRRFTGADGRVFPISASMLDRVWKRIRKEIGAEDVRIHDLRHSFASFAVNNGVPLEIVQQLLGHSSILTTQRYAHLATETLSSALNELDKKLAAVVPQRG